MSGHWPVDWIIAIDFGMTCTGVAYSCAPDFEVRYIQKWPGKPQHEIHNKVDTSISYDVRTGQLKGWGFLCDHDDDGEEVNQYWKLNLDPAYVGLPDDPAHEVAAKWYRDYMFCIREHTLGFLRDSFPHFDRKNVEFVISVPTTWRDPGLIAQIEQHIQAAGYGQSHNERVTISLTEAEAAAVYALKSGMTIGESFVVCDAGGGTSDVNVLRVVSTGTLALEALSYVEGRAVGSVLIDYKAQKLVSQRLKLIREHVPGDIDAIAEQMVRDGFHTFKCSFGSVAYNAYTKLKLQIPGLSLGTDFPGVNVEDSRLVISRRATEGRKGSASVRDYGKYSQSHLVLSGGFGSSPYLRRRLKERYEGGQSSLHTNASGMKVLLADQPQLAVVHGLIMAKSQLVKLGLDVYAKKCCPISVGILSREKYDQSKHQGETVTLDPLDNQRWAERQIRWIISKGDVVQTEKGKPHPYRRKIPLGQEHTPWRTQIVMSTLPKDRLPKSLPANRPSENGKELCEIEAVLDPKTLRRKNHKWYHLRREYKLAEFSVILHISTGLRFEIVSKDGTSVKSHEEISVAWEPVTVQSAQPEVAPTMYPVAQQNGWHWR
ncbi:hypothetical protein LTR95_002088 [Oleoguttula sp. CCFEE 5521]